MPPTLTCARLRANGGGRGTVPPKFSEEMELTLALSRKFLESIGLEEKQCDAIIEANEETIAGLKSEIAQYKSEAAKVPALQKKLEDAVAADKTSELQSQLDEATKAKQDAEAALAEATRSLDDFRAEVQAEKDAAAKAGAYRRQVLEAAGVAADYVDDVMAVTKLDGLELDDDGNIVGAEKLVESAKEKWHSFVVRSKTDPAKVDMPPTPPAGDRQFEGANPRAVQIAKERHERLYGKSEE